VDLIPAADNIYFTCRFIHGHQSPAEPHLACIESWEVFKENYHLPIVEGAEKILPDGSSHTPVNVGYIDSRRDTVLIGAQTIQALQNFGVWLNLSRVENLALAGHTQIQQQQQSVWMYSHVMCPHLRSLTIVLDTIDPDADNPDYEGYRLHLSEVNIDLRLLEINRDSSVDSSGIGWGKY